MPPFTHMLEAVNPLVGFFVTFVENIFLEKLGNKVDNSATKKLSELMQGFRQDSGLETLPKIMEYLSSDFMKLRACIKNEALGKLLSSFDYFQRGLIQLDFDYKKLDSSLDEANASKSIIKLDNCTKMQYETLPEKFAKEFETACQFATEAFHNDNLDLIDKLLSLQIILFCLKLTKHIWEKLWDQEIIYFLNSKGIMKILQNPNDKNFISFTEFIVVIKNFIGKQYCLPKVQNFLENNISGNDKILKYVLSKPCRHQQFNFTKTVALVKEFLKLNVRLLLNNYSSLRKMYNCIKKPCIHVVRSVQLMKLCQFNDGDTDLHILARKAPSNKYYEKAIRYRLRKNTVDELNDNGFTPIMVAAQCGNEKFLTLRLEFPADVNFARNNGRTALHYAAHYGHAQCVSILLAKGAHLSKKTESGDTALHIAASANTTDCLKILLASGIDVNETNKRGYTSLHKAAENGNVDSIKLLLENKASINTLADEGATALYLAANAGHKPAIEVLIDSGADVNLGQRENYPLFGAAVMGYADIVSYLIEKGANPYPLVNTENETFTYSVVHAASVGGSVELLKNLEIGGFEMDLPEEHGYTPLMLAVAKSDKVECVEFLLERTKVQCDNVRTKEENQTLLHLSMHGKDKPQVVEILLKNKADPNARDNLAMTPVMLASKYGRCESLKILLQRGGDPRLQARNGLTALHAACINGSVDCINELLNAKVDVNAVTGSMGKKCTALDLCNESDWSNKELCIEILKKASGDTYENRERITSSIRNSKVNWKLPA